jgi:hypothetical protein
MVQGPCAHMVLHHRFINSYWVYKEVISHQTQHSRLYSYWICTKFQVNSISGYKTCPAKTDKFWPLWPWKFGQIKNPGIMSCIFIRCTHDNNLELIQSLVQEHCSTLCVFSIGPPGDQAKNQIGPKFGLLGHLTKGYIMYHISHH